MKRIWVHKADSFKEAENFDKLYYFKMSRRERLEMVQFLRELYFKIKRERKDEDRKRLRRVVKVI